MKINVVNIYQEVSKSSVHAPNYAEIYLKLAIGQNNLGR